MAVFVLVIVLVLFTETFRIGAASGRQSLRSMSNVRDATIGVTVFTFLAGLVGSVSPYRPHRSHHSHI
jgi:hypothetical protein